MCAPDAKYGEHGEGDVVGRDPQWLPSRLAELVVAIFRVVVVWLSSFH
jgi:hypothetical protein